MLLVSDAEALPRLNQLMRGKRMLLAIEADPAARHRASPEMLAVSNGERDLVFDLRACPETWDLLRSSAPLAAFDAKVLHKALRRAGREGIDRWACIKVTEQLLAAGAAMAFEAEDIRRRYGARANDLTSCSVDALGAQARFWVKVVEAQIEALKKLEMVQVSKLEAGAVAPIAEMELRGMAFDKARWDEVLRVKRAELTELREQLGQMLRDDHEDLFGRSTINLESDQALKAALHRLGHEVPNTRRRTLETIPAPLGPKLLRYRELAKIVGSYGDNFLSSLGPGGRLHPTFEQIGASTGRMACHTPNLQAVAGESEVRSCFRCGPGRKLVIADYAACELRILAEMSRDPVFCEAFEKGDDLHAKVACSIFGKPVSKENHPELRQRAKVVNFGLVYGMGASGLARSLAMGQGAAQELLDSYFRTFPRIKDYLDASARIAIQRGYAVTMTGRRLRLHRSRPNDRAEQGHLARIAKNMPIQGTSADITKLALGALHGALREYPEAWIVNAVHDEIVVECPAGEVSDIEEIMAKTMRSAACAVLKQVPMDVSVTVGDYWEK